MTRQRWQEMVGAYVLDALDPEERAAFEARLTDDPELQREVGEARASTLALAESLPDFDLPADLRTRVMERVREAQRADERSSADTPPRRRHSVAPWLLLAASVAGLFWLGSENRDLMNRSRTLAAQLDSVRGSLGQAQVALARFDSLALALSGPNVQLATLSGETAPSLRLVWNRDLQLMLVAARSLPLIPEDRTFQLWGIRGEEAPVSLGTFDTDAQGNALVTLRADTLEDFDLSAITEEPEGGSPQPTTQPFLAGAWSEADE